MDRKRSVLYSCVYRWLLMLLLLIGLTVSAAQAETVQYTLMPDDLVYEDGNIVLHKQAERIGPDEWRVNVSAAVKETPVEIPKIEVTFVLDTSNSMLGCPYELLHNEGYWHMHNAATCPFGTECKVTNLMYHSSTRACSIDFGNGWEDVSPNRYDIAYEAINKLTATLPGGTDIHRVVFSIPAYTDTVTAFDANFKQFGGGTHLMRGVNLGCDQFEDPDATQILIIVTDGEATHDINGSNLTDVSTRYTTQKFEEFNGIVYTVGFNHIDPHLEGMVKNGGSYYHASNPGELTEAFDAIGAKLTAMIEDPMGNVVGFDQVTNQNITSGDGKITTVGNTIYWSPSDNSDENDDLKGTIAYHYTVKLNEQAKTAAGVHGATVDDPVPLNNPTYFHYGTADEMKKVDFPIPYAQYAVSTLQTTWKTVDDTKTFQTTDLEKIVGCDFKKKDGSWYFTDFTQDYAIKDSFTDNGATYLYVGTEITINGGAPIVVQTAKALEELVKAYESNAYQVVHLYEKNMPLKLTVSKIVSGNMGSRNSKFDFTVTLPDMAGQTVGCTLGNTPTTLTLDVQGKASFSLSHDQTLVMNNVHGNYQVEEAPYGSYVTTVSVNDGQAEQKNSVMGKLAASNTYVAYTNSLDATIPTGVFTSSASALAGLLLSAVMFTITRAGRRARDDE